MFSPLIDQLIQALRDIPGIGPKTAQRLCFQLLAKNYRGKAQQLAKALEQAMVNVAECQRCRTYTEQAVCNICQNPKRKANQLCIVESPTDIAAIEQTQTYFGHYFVLHGHLSPLDGIGPQELKLNQLFQQIINGHYDEIIIATNPTMEGEATAHYIVNHLNNHPVCCTRLAHGVPIGGEIEYLDGNTLSHALNARITIKQQHEEHL